MEQDSREALRREVQRHAELVHAFRLLVDNPDTSAAAIARLHRRIERCVDRQRRLVADLGAITPAPRTSSLPAGVVPLRERILATLDRIGVPAAPRDVSDVAQASAGAGLPTERFASLRRDEERAYDRNPGARPAWVVPAISAAHLTAIQRLVAHSAWEAERRLIGARTLRANHLRTLRALLQIRDRLATGDPSAADRLAALITQYAESVPGALKRDVALDTARVLQAVEAELALIDTSDQEERAAAARRLRALSAKQQLWGRPPQSSADE